MTRHALKCELLDQLFTINGAWCTVHNRNADACYQAARRDTARRSCDYTSMWKPVRLPCVYQPMPNRPIML